MILNYFHELNRLDETWELEEVFETHDELNQQLFDNDILRKDIRQRLLEIVDLFISKIKEDNIPINVIDYWLLGSNAAYNYGPKSDIDIHIIVNLEDLGVDPYILQVLYNYIKSDFNNKYDIEIKGHEVELYLEDVRSGAVTNGIYSLKQNRWIKFPTRTEYMRFDVTETDEYKDWYQRYLSLEDSEIEQFINDLYLMRKESLATDGEWGTGNLVFKEFRNSGFLDSLKDRKYEYKSKGLTLENLEEDLLCENWWKLTLQQEVDSSPILKEDPVVYVKAKTEGQAKDIFSNRKNGSEKINKNLTNSQKPETILKAEKLKLKGSDSDLYQILNSTQMQHVFTLSHSTLRKHAHKEVNADVKQKYSDDRNKYLIHHKDGNEGNKSKTNLLAIPYENGNQSSRNIADLIHQILDRLGIGKGSCRNYSISIFEYDKNGDLSKGSLEIALKNSGIS